MSCKFENGKSYKFSLEQYKLDMLVTNDKIYDWSNEADGHPVKVLGEDFGLVCSLYLVSPDWCVED